MNDLDEKRTQLQDLVNSIAKTSSCPCKGLHNSGRTYALTNLTTPELLQFLDQTGNLITVITISECPELWFKVIFRI